MDVFCSTNFELTWKSPTYVKIKDAGCRTYELVGAFARRYVQVGEHDTSQGALEGEKAEPSGGG